MHDQELGVEKPDLVETTELKNPSDQVYKTCTVARIATNHKELKPMKIPKRDDVQRLKHTNHEWTQRSWKNTQTALEDQEGIDRSFGRSDASRATAEQAQQYQRLT